MTRSAETTGTTEFARFGLLPLRSRLAMALFAAAMAGWLVWRAIDVEDTGFMESAPLAVGRTGLLVAAGAVGAVAVLTLWRSRGGRSAVVEFDGEQLTLRPAMGRAKSISVRDLRLQRVWWSGGVLTATSGEQKLLLAVPDRRFKRWLDDLGVTYEYIGRSKGYNAALILAIVASIALFVWARWLA